MPSPTVPRNHSELVLAVISLMGQWQRLAQGHIPLGGYSCACSLSFGGITMVEVERDIVEYLREKHEGVQGLEGLFLQDENEAQAELSLTSLLRRLTEDTLPFDEAFKVLGDLENSLAGLAKLHTTTSSSI